MRKRYLLDTHALIWFLEGNGFLPIKPRQIITDTENDIFANTATLWEIAIKVSIGKLLLYYTLEEIIKKLNNNKINILQIEPPAILHLLNLPFHHKDPFDRLLIAQSVTENLTLLSNELLFDKYNVIRIWSVIV